MRDIAIPPIDRRSAPDIDAQLRTLLRVYAPAWAAADADAGAALVGAFARLAELLIERLNRAPAKNQLAFFDLLGAAPLPPQPARVPLSFTLAAGSRRDAFVPAGSCVAAPPAPGSSQPLLFETDRDLVVSAATLAAAFTREPAADRWAEHSPRLLGAAPSSMVSVFEGDTPVDHVLCLGHAELFGRADVDEWRLRVDTAPGATAPDARSVRWEAWDGLAGVPLQVRSDGTAGLSQPGTVVLRASGPVPLLELGGRTNRWLRCRLVTPISLLAGPRPGTVRAAHLGELAGVAVQGRLERRALAPQAAFANARRLDADDAWWPFGQQPGFGDALYLASDDAFTHAGAAITLHVELANPRGAAAPAPLRAAAASADLRLEWACWDGRAWATVAPAADTTERLTKSGDVRLTLPAAPPPRSVNGVRGHWLRVRIATGHYGVPESFGAVPAPSTLAPPVIAALRIDVDATLPEVAPQQLLALNDFEFQALDGRPFKPFRPAQDTRAALYLGLRPPAGAPALANAPFTLFGDVPELPFGRPPDDAGAATPARTAWEYFDGQAWQALVARDGSAGLTQAGTVDFLVPADLALRADFGVAPCGWLRLRWVDGEFRFLPRVRQLLPNTTMATQARTVRDEVLGSSDGSPGQRFTLSHRPVLEGERLLVREEAWELWTAVADFHASGPRDRHYTIDRLQGEVHFGNGVRGRIPPPGAGNVRMAQYRAGGGRAGNVAAGTATGLQAAIALVDGAANHCAASGGADAEDLPAFVDRAPRTLRHRGRAVALADYEDLACQASAEVARAKAWDLVDLALDPDGGEERPGRLSLVVVPHSADPRPQPSLALLQRVHAVLDACRSPLAALAVVGPEYLRVDVRVELVPVSLDAAGTLDGEVRTALARFLHPLTGGLDGTGWTFGRRPHRSDLFALIERITAVDHVRLLQVSEKEERLGVAAAGRFLVASGEHRVTLAAEAN